MKLDKKLETKLRSIGAKLDANRKEASALIAAARREIGFKIPHAIGILEYYFEEQGHDCCPENMGEDLVRYAQHTLQSWEREEGIAKLRAEIELLGLTKEELFPPALPLPTE